MSTQTVGVGSLLRAGSSRTFLGQNDGVDERVRRRRLVSQALLQASLQPICESRQGSDVPSAHARKRSGQGWHEDGTKEQCMLGCERPAVAAIRASDAVDFFQAKKKTRLLPLNAADRALSKSIEIKEDDYQSKS